MAFEYLKSMSGGLDKNAALSDIMLTYGEDVWNYAFFLSKNRTLADDVTQDVFVRVYERLYTFRGEASIKTWLLAITRNLVRDHWRSAWIRRVIPSAFCVRKARSRRRNRK